VVAVAQKAYDTYQKFSGGQMTLEQATALIVSAITQAKVEIITHIDILTAGEVQACARNAVIGVLDLHNMHPDTAQQFALDATGCATLAQARIGSFEALSAVDLAGLALNVVGPIALLARAHTHLPSGTPELVSTLRDANTSLKTRLKPSCISTALGGDAEPGGIMEYELICTAYNGNRGYGSGTGNKPFNWNRPITQAMQGTSYLVALAALPRL
jgi:hypothetical protein